MRKIILGTIIVLFVYVVFFVSPVREVIDPLPRFQRGIIFLSLAIIGASVAILWREFIIVKSWRRTRKDARKIANCEEDHVQKKSEKKEIK